jgi:MFS family permease
MNRNVWLLFVCQGLVNASSISQVTMSALIGYSLATDKALATLPYGLQMTATMAASIPAGIIFARLGRKPGFMAGAAATLLGTILYAAGVVKSNFALYCLGAIPTGIGFGIGQHYRFAAAEVAPAEKRSTAISLVMAAGVISAILGPEMVKYTKELAMPVLFLGTYLCLLALPVASMVMLAITRLPPSPPRQASPTPISAIIARPNFLIAVIAGLVAYGTMNLIMVSTPLEMKMCGFGVNDSASVISIHAFCMFAPGFFTGRLIDRFGPHRLILVGGLLNFLCIAIAVTGSEFIHFAIALGALGVGWNFMFVGASSLLARAHSASERVRTQVTNDFIVFGTVAMTALTSGAIHDYAGWSGVNLTVVPFLLVALGLVAWNYLRAGRTRAAAIAAQ